MSSIQDAARKSVDHALSYHELAGNQPTEPPEPLPQETPEPKLPINIAVLMETKRIRSSLLPMLYKELYGPQEESGTQLSKEELAQSARIINGALSLAEWAISNREDDELLAALTLLRNF